MKFHCKTSEELCGLSEILSVFRGKKNRREKETKRKIHAEKIYHLFHHSVITSEELCRLSEILSALCGKKNIAEKIFHLFRYSLITSEELCDLRESLSALCVKKTAEKRRTKRKFIICSIIL